MNNNVLRVTRLPIPRRQCGRLVHVDVSWSAPHTRDAVRRYWLSRTRCAVGRTPGAPQYLTGAHNDAVAAVAQCKSIGLLVQPGNRYDKQVHRYPTWAGDNGAFTKTKAGFRPEKFREMLRRPALLAARATCQFIVAPDRLVVLPDGTVVGDARGTLDQFPAWAAEIRGLGYPVALVAQNGLETILDEVPWHLVDCLFLGGSTEWKIGPGAAACVARARAQGKLTHMGRVNSGVRMRIAQDFGCDTVDGTFLAFGPTKNLPRLISWIDDAERRAKGGTSGEIESVPSGTNKRVRRQRVSGLAAARRGEART